MKKFSRLLIREPKTAGVYYERTTYLDDDRNEYIKLGGKYVRIEVRYYDSLPLGYIVEG